MKHFGFTLPFLAALAVTSVTSMASADTTLTVTNGDTVVEMNAETLNALPQVTFETTTIWTEGAITFSGPSLHSLVTQAGITEGTLSLTAVNDYAIQISVADIEDDAPIVATLMDGEPIGRREKGPYWLVFPYDSEAKYQSEDVYSQSIWQLVSIELDATN